LQENAKTQITMRAKSLYDFNILISVKFIF